VGRNHDAFRRDDADFRRPQPMRNEVSDQCRDGDRRQAVRRIAADNELETVKGASERRPEGPRNSTGRAATDHDAKVRPPQAERHADARRDAARELGVAGLKPNRRPNPARPHRLDRDDDAAEKRHASAVQRIGFNRIDFPFRAPMSDQFTRHSERETAEQGNQNRNRRIEPKQPGEAHAGVQMKQQPMQGVHASAHGGHHQTGDRPDRGREDDETRFSRPHHGPESPGYLQLVDHSVDHRITITSLPR
jgi:hypothetical protein